MSCKIAGKIYFFIQQHLIELAQLVKNPPADSGSIPGSGRSRGEGIDNPLQYSRVNKSTCNKGDLGSVSELGRSAGGGHGNPV